MPGAVHVYTSLCNWVREWGITVYRQYKPNELPELEKVVEPSATTQIRPKMFCKVRKSWQTNQSQVNIPNTQIVLDPNGMFQMKKHVVYSKTENMT